MSEDLLDTLILQFGNDKKFSIIRKKDFLRLFEEGDIRFNQILNDIIKMDIEKRQSANLKEIEALHVRYSELFHRKVKGILKRKDVKEDSDLSDKSEVIFDELSSKIKILIKGYEASLIKKMNQSDEKTERAKRVITIIFTSVILLSLIITAKITYGKGFL